MKTSIRVLTMRTLGCIVALSGIAATSIEAAVTTYTVPNNITGDWTTTAWTKSGGDAAGLFPNRTGDIAQQTAGSGGSTLTLDASVSVGQIKKTANGTLTINNSDPASAFTLDNTGGTTNAFSTSNAAIGGGGANSLSINVPIVFGNTDLDLGTASGTGFLGINNGINASTAGRTLYLRLNGSNGTNNVTTIAGDIGASGQSFAIVNAGTSTSNVSTISGNLGSLVSSFTNAGQGTLILSGDNSTYTGGYALNAGLLRVNSANALGSTGTISFGGGTLQLTSNNLSDYSARFSTAADQAYSIDTNGQNSAIDTALNSVGGSLTKSGTGTLTLSVNNSYSGNTTIIGGSLSIDAEAKLGSTPGSATANNIRLSGGTLHVSADTSLSVNRGIGIGPTSGGTGGSATFDINSTRTLTVNGLVASAGNTGTNTLTKTGAGTMILANTNLTYDGNYSVTNGTLEVASLASGGTITLGSGSNSVTFRYTGGAQLVTREIRVHGQSNGKTLNSSGFGALVIAGGVTNTQSTTTGNEKVFTLTGTNLNNNEIQGAVVDLNTNPSSNAVRLAVAKTGDGKWILSGDSTYTGTTTISAGTLLVNGTHNKHIDNTGAGVASYTVSGTGTLGGSGHIHTNVTVGATSFLAPGASVGTLTVTGNATINGTLKIELDGSTSDLLNVNGTLNITNAKLDFDQLSSLTTNRYILATYTSLTGTFAEANIFDLPSGYTIDYAYNGNSISISAVPEPSAFLLALLGMVAVPMVIRRRKLAREHTC